MKTPILFIIFNNINTVEKVFGAIKKQKPNKLFIACDGARKNLKGEEEKCKIVKDFVLNNIDWNCEINTMFLKDNLGPAKAIYKFIFWFLEKEEQGIILEHDCLPNDDFFVYCEELLEKYKHNEKISCICGNNSQEKVESCENSYYFSYIPQLWGFAIWKRSLDGYDLYLKNYTLKEFKKDTKRMLTAKHEKRVFIDKFLSMKKQGYNTWDYQYMFNMWHKHSFSVVPKYNLVSNIGFCKSALHCKNEKDSRSKEKTYPILPLKHPNRIEVNKKADDVTYYALWYKTNLKLLYRFFLRKFIMKRKFQLEKNK
ncbi:MAG: hypothetical protein LKE30_05435 [Bacteroidales bacterium]|jgi:hypothetical protein|nr:hypothetical protein [Bacteroidales bacterium]